MTSRFFRLGERVEDHFKMIGKVGSGAYGAVWKAERLSTSKDQLDRFVAVKKPDQKLLRSGVAQDAYREIMLLKELDHQNILKVRQVFATVLEQEDSANAAPNASSAPSGKGSATAAAANAAAASSSSSSNPAAPNAPAPPPPPIPNPSVAQGAASAAASAGSSSKPTKPTEELRKKQHVGPRTLLNLVFHYAEYDLASIISYHHKNNIPLDALVIKSILFQLLDGMTYLHKNWIMHRDIKPANILIMGSDSSEKGVVKIADFGLARIFQGPLRPLRADGDVVTIWYRAPELLLGAYHYTPAVDMWAVGCIFAEMMMCQALFKCQVPKQGRAHSFQQIQVTKVVSILGTPTRDVWPLLDQHPHAPQLHKIEHKQRCFGSHMRRRAGIHAQNANAMDLLEKMLLYDPDQRITAEEALNHPYFVEHPHPRKKDCLKPANGSTMTYHPRRISTPANDRAAGRALANSGVSSAIRGKPAAATASAASHTGINRFRRNTTHSKNHRPRKQRRSG